MREGETETMKKYRVFLTGVCLFLVITGCLLWNVHGITDSLWMKVRWNLNFPVMVADKEYRDWWTEYRIYECSDREERIVKSSLFPQTPTESWVSDIVKDLKNLNVSEEDYPSFSTIDYCIRKQVRDSKLVILLDSADNILYLYKCSR